jgi:hypothetical protein
MLKKAAKNHQTHNLLILLEKPGVAGIIKPARIGAPTLLAVKKRKEKNMSYDTYRKALEAMWEKERALESALSAANKHPPIVASWEKRTNDALAKHTHKKAEETNYTRDLNTAKSMLSAAQTAKTKDTKKIKELQTRVDNLNATLQRVRQEITALWNEYQNVKKELDAKKREQAADQQKQKLAKSQYDAAVKKMEYEQPWYLKLGDKVSGKTNDTIIVGSKVYNAVDWEKMEKAAVAAGKAVGAMKDPPDTILKALDTIGKYLGYINKINTAIDTAVSVNDAVNSLKMLIAAGKSYSKATSDSQKVDAIEAITIYSFFTLEKAFNIKGGIISSVASVGSQFCTSLAKAVAATIRLGQNRTYMIELTYIIANSNRNDSIYTAAQSVSGGYEIAVKMIQDNKTDAQVLEALDAYKTLKKAS